MCQLVTRRSRQLSNKYSIDCVDFVTNLVIFFMQDDGVAREHPTHTNSKTTSSENQA